MTQCRSLHSQPPGPAPSSSKETSFRKLFMDLIRWHASIPVRVSMYHKYYDVVVIWRMLHLSALCLTIPCNIYSLAASRVLLAFSELQFKQSLTQQKITIYSYHLSKSNHNGFLQIFRQIHGRQRPRTYISCLERNKQQVCITLITYHNSLTSNSIARDPNVPADARLRAGFRGLGDRWKQHSNRRQAAAHSHAAKHNY